MHLIMQFLSRFVLVRKAASLAADMLYDLAQRYPRIQHNQFLQHRYYDLCALSEAGRYI